MPRTARVLDPEGVYHVTCRGNNKAVVFHDEQDMHAYRRIMTDCKKAFPFRLYHYVFMSNHVHLVIKLLSTVPMAKIMKKISQGYAQYYNKRYGRVGHLWQDRYHAKQVTSDAQLLATGMYVEMNPVRAGMAKIPSEYPWSSYGYYVLEKNDTLVDATPFYETLGSGDLQRRTAYQRLCKGTVPLGTGSWG